MAVAVEDPRAVRAALLGWLGARLGDAGVDVGSLAPPAAGQSNETVVFEATWAEAGVRQRAELVLRRQPTRNRLFLEPDVLLEFRVMQALETGSPLPVPHMLWAEDDPDVLGGPFFVMAKVPGTVPAGKPSIHQ